MIKSSLMAFLSRLSKRERSILYTTVALVAAGLLNQIFLSPILSKMRQRDQEIKLQEEKIKKSFMILSREKQISNERSKYFSVSGNLESEEEAMTTFLKDIENLAKESSVYLIDIKPMGGKENEKGSSNKYFLELNFEAKMDQVLNFFQGLTQSEQLIKIERYQIRPKTEGSSTVTCGLSISKLIVADKGKTK